MSASKGSSKSPSSTSNSNGSQPTIPLPPSEATVDEFSSLGIIVGAIVGGTLLIGAIVLIYFLFCRGAAERMNTSSRKLTIKQKSSKKSKRKSVSNKKSKSKKK